MPLPLAFGLVLFATFALLWSTALLVQPYLYTTVADRLPARSAVGALLVALFSTVWAWVHAGANPPEKYGVIYEFNPTVRADVPAFEAVRQLRAKGPDGKPKEVTVAFQRVPGSTPEQPVYEEAGHPGRRYQPRGADYMTVGVLVPVGPNGEKLRFDARVKDGVLDPDKEGFREAGGSRYIESIDAPSLVHTPNRGAVLGALALNFLAFAVWVAALLAVRYSPGFALLGGAAGWVFMVLVLMPILFEKTTAKPAPAPAAPAVAR